MRKWRGPARACEIHEAVRRSRGTVEAGTAREQNRVIVALADDLAEARALLERMLPDDGDTCEAAHDDSEGAECDCQGVACLEHARRAFLARTK